MILALVWLGLASAQESSLNHGPVLLLGGGQANSLSGALLPAGRVDLGWEAMPAPWFGIGGELGWTGAFGDDGRQEARGAAVVTLRPGALRLGFGPAAGLGNLLGEDVDATVNQGAIPRSFGVGGTASAGVVLGTDGPWGLLFDVTATRLWAGEGSWDAWGLRVGLAPKAWRL